MDEARPSYRQVDVETGVWPDERSYRITLMNGEPFRVESVFAGFRCLTYREVKRNGAAWKRALKAAGMSSRIGT